MKNVRQLAYVCPLADFERTLDYWEQAFDAAPFFLGDIEPENQTFNGVRTSARVRIGLTYLGNVQIEVVAPLNDADSPWAEPLGAVVDVPPAGLFHHMLLDSDDYDGTRARLLDAGLVPAYEAEFAGRRLCYLDGRDRVGCYVELIEWREWNELVFEKMQAACRDYRGTEPRRSFGDLVREARSSQPDA